MAFVSLFWYSMGVYFLSYVQKNLLVSGGNSCFFEAICVARLYFAWGSNWICK